MKSNRKAREVALQVLFQQSFQEAKSPLDLFNSFADNFEFDQNTRDYALFLTQSVIEKSDELDQVIATHSRHWRVDRLAVIDRILLQIGIYELMFSTNTETAPKLTMTDILDLSKKYSSDDSKSFINGILDQVYSQSNPNS